jgi:hypothetical protein
MRWNLGQQKFLREAASARAASAVTGTKARVLAVFVITEATSVLAVFVITEGVSALVGPAITETTSTRAVSVIT